MASRENGCGGGVIEGINMTPLVDILLVLLVIFIATATVVDRKELGIRLPSSSGAPVSNQESITVTIDAEGEFTLEGVSYPLNRLTGELEVLRKSRGNLKIRLDADRSLPYGSVTEILGKIRSSGFTQVALGVEESG